jgi:hypothetical protein
MTLKEFLDSDKGAEVKEFFITEKDKVFNIKNVKLHSSASAQSLEFKAQLKAAVILESILNKIMTIDRMTKIKDNQNDYL